MKKYNRNIKTNYSKFRPNGVIYKIMSPLIKFSSKDELILYNQVAFFSLLAPLIVFVLTLVYRISSNRNYLVIFTLVMLVNAIVQIIISLWKKQSIFFYLFIVIVSTSLFIIKYYFNDFFDISESNWYVILGGIVLIIFFYSLLGISSLLRMPNKKLFIGLIKYSVGCSLIAIYAGFLMFGAWDIESRKVSDIIGNITVLITSIFFFLDGTHDMYDYLEEGNMDYKDRNNYKTYIYSGMIKKYIFKRTISLIKKYIWLNFCLMYIPVIYACNVDFSNKESIIASMIYMFIILVICILVLPFGDMGIKFIKENNEINNKDIDYFQSKLRERMKISKCSKFNPKYIRNCIGNFIINKIFEEVKIDNTSLLNEEEKRVYYERYIKFDNKDAMKIEYDDIANCEWYTITNKRGEFIGDGFVLDKENRSLIFVFVTPFKRGKGFGSLILKELEKKTEMEEKYIQMHDKIRNKEMKTFMLLKNNYNQLID